MGVIDFNKSKAVKAKKALITQNNEFCWHRLRQVIKEDIPRDIDGMAIVAFRRGTDEEGAPIVETWANFRVRDPLDRYKLADLAYAKLVEIA